MKWLLVLPAILSMALPVHAEPSQSPEGIRFYLVMKSASSSDSGSAVSFQTVPMNSMEQCEVAGAVLVSSKRFQNKRILTEFECIEGGR